MWVVLLVFMVCLIPITTVKIIQQVQERARLGQVKKAINSSHNEMDYECIYWHGDLNPEPEDYRNRELDRSKKTFFRDRRCLVCHPYDEIEARQVNEALSLSTAINNELNDSKESVFART